MSLKAFTITLTMILCPLTYFSVYYFGAMGTLTIMLVPIAFLFRMNSKDDTSLGDPNRG